MKAKTKKVPFKVGDEVESVLLRSTLEKVKIRGKVKKVILGFGRRTYVITGGVAADFKTRTLKKIKE